MSPHVAGPPPTNLYPAVGGSDGHVSAGDAAALTGLTDEKRDEILATPKGSRPDPGDYLSPDYIKQHLDKFSQGGTRFMLQENLDRFGIAQRDGTSFVFPTSEIDTLVSLGKLTDVENALGLPEGYLKDFDVVRVDVSDLESYNVRIPSGNEAGANEYWLPGGRLPGGMLEAVIDGAEVLTADLRILGLDDCGSE